MTEITSNPSTQLDSGSSETYIQVTHHFQHNIRQTTPSDFGICFTPLPFSLIRPNYVTISADNLPHCKSCGAFINKYAKQDMSTFVCSVCGQTNQNKMVLYLEDSEFSDDVYDSYCTDYPVRRKQFVPTDLLVISLSLLKKFPSLVDILSNAYMFSSAPKQVGLVIIHGGITIVKFRDHLSFNTYAFEIPTVNLPQFFISASTFRESLPMIQRQLQELSDIPQEIETSTNFIKFAVQSSFLFGSSVKFFLDEKDFHIAFNYKESRKDALNACRYCSQISFFLFPTSKNFSVLYRNPLFDLCSITGGHLKMFKINENNIDESFSRIKNELTECLRTTLLHDTVLKISTPNDCTVKDYAGNGFLETTRVLKIPKIKVGDSFFFKFNAKEFKHPFLQFVLFFTTDVGVRKMRIYTVPIEKFKPIDYNALSKYIAAFVSQRFIIEDDCDLKKYIKSIEAKYSKFLSDYPILYKAQTLLNSTDYGDMFIKALIYRLFIQQDSQQRSNPQENESILV